MRIILNFLCFNQLRKAVLHDEIHCIREALHFVIREVSIPQALINEDLGKDVRTKLLNIYEIIEDCNLVMRQLLDMFNLFKNDKTDLLYAVRILIVRNQRVINNIQENKDMDLQVVDFINVQRAVLSL